MIRIWRATLLLPRLIPIKESQTYHWSLCWLWFDTGPIFQWCFIVKSQTSVSRPLSVDGFLCFILTFCYIWKRNSSEFLAKMRAEFSRMKFNIATNRYLGHLTHEPHKIELFWVIQLFWLICPRWRGFWFWDYFYHMVEFYPSNPRWPTLNNLNIGVWHYVQPLKLLSWRHSLFSSHR